MESRRFGEDYVLRFDRGEEIVAALTEFARKEGVTLGSVEAIGAADRVTIGLYNVAEQRYYRHTFEEAMEITSLLGNISTQNGEPYLHLHIDLCREDMSAIGGHLNECRISATCEMFVRRLDGRVERRHDAETGLNLYEFL